MGPHEDQCTAREIISCNDASVDGKQRAMGTICLGYFCVWYSCDFSSPLLSACLSPVLFLLSVFSSLVPVPMLEKLGGLPMHLVTGRDKFCPYRCHDTE